MPNLENFVVSLVLANSLKDRDASLISPLTAEQLKPVILDFNMMAIQTLVSQYDNDGTRIDFLLKKWREYIDEVEKISNIKIDEIPFTQMTFWRIVQHNVGLGLIATLEEELSPEDITRFESMLVLDNEREEMFEYVEELGLVLSEEEIEKLIKEWDFNNTQSEEKVVEIINNLKKQQTAHFLNRLKLLWHKGVNQFQGMLSISLHEFAEELMVQRCAISIGKKYGGAHE